MMNWCSLFCAMVLMLMCGTLISAAADEASAPQSGVPHELAAFRAAHYSNLRYALQLEVAAGAEMLKGEEEIHLTLDAEAGDLVIDWRINQTKEGQQQPRVWDIKVNGREMSAARFVSDHIIIPRDYLSKGENTIRLKFESPISTSGSALTRYIDREDKAEYIYTLFVPSDASTAFPCFDQPDLKARFKLDIVTPEEWTVITNTTPEQILKTPDREGALGQHRRRLQFHETEPISTYLFAFAAGPFAQFRDESSALGTHLYVRQSKMERARKEAPEVFRLTREGVKFLSGYFDFKFPFPKYDLVLVPEFAYGGMEHAGATFLREDGILFPSDPTANDLLSRAEVIFHETAHQWFGDLVTMRWFDDLWLKEGFATFMAYKAIEAVMPEYSSWKVFYQRTKPSAYLTDATKGTTPIWQEIANLSAAKSAYGNIVYRKAPSILRQAEFYLGPDKFQRAIQIFLKEHAYSNAEWNDLVRAFERTSGMKLDLWAAAWVKRRGMPDVRVEWSADARGRINSFALKQEDVLREGGAWPMRVEILLAHQNAQPESMTVTLGATGETRVREAIGKVRPDYVFANYRDYGYGRFLLDEKSRLFVLKNLGGVKDDFLRALLWGSLWDSVREAELAPTDYIDLALKLLPTERDEVSAQSILSRVSTAFNRYLSAAQMTEAAARLEPFLYDRMLHAETVGLRITYFRSFQNIATTEHGRSVLKDLLTDKLKIQGMTLRSRDRFDLITSLMARGDKDAPRLLEEESAKDQTSDAKRYAYAAGAARADEETKKKYFDAYTSDHALAESWIEASMNPFNAIQQSELTFPYLKPALNLLPELKRTRKIFFVNGWLAAFIGGQCNDRALSTVQDFLKDTQLDRDLRLKVLETVDGLERCVRIRAKYAQREKGATAARRRD